MERTELPLPPHIWAKLGTVDWYAEQRGPDEWWIWLRRRPE